MREAVSSGIIAAAATAAAVGVRNFAGCAWVAQLIHVVCITTAPGTDGRGITQQARLSYPTDSVRALLPPFYQTKPSESR